MVRGVFTQYRSGPFNPVAIGVSHGLLLMIVFGGLTFFSDYLGIDAEDSANLLVLVYIVLAIMLGYFWKRRHGTTFILGKSSTNKPFIRYALSVVFLPTLSTIAIQIGELRTLGWWWPGFALVLFVVGLFAQALNFAFLAKLGGWFYRD